MKSVSIDQITSTNPALLSLQQRFDVSITAVQPPEFANAKTLVFVSTAELLQKALANQAQALIVLQSLYQDAGTSIPSNICVWTTPNISQAMSLVLPLFDQKTDFLKAGIHPTASIHPTATVAPTAHVGAYAVIEAHAHVGDNTVIYPHVYIGPFCEIGSRCHISSHVSIGSDGFGFFTDKTFTHHKIPQIGKVVIEDDCELGSHCAVDRATLTETRIKKGSKFDNFCHIAHNVQIGENALVAAGFMVSGSTIIGKNLMVAGGVHVTGHISIADSTILTGRAGVTNSIEKGGMYGGFPLESHKESLKTLVSLPHVKKMRKQISKILAHLNLTDE
ncbi:UDP-3-O-(3-hydroxymyristoyl)glucosamine N-acyltransferase [Pseudobdellovibrio exovorus]|uniref:UDP glucosamine N-acyltransferase n=1 Tax=Pseudobdellovibrio exovorus JSS TaxID=1184267 RepID=M4V992_9BACT|nr:UDP-3-O-(3-hydroxymyristoyl)glucosamine N-acyltransferase [Pseudobdellovibrio exovorus]AGH95000.1 UDP glucosamine N-acyltransferase [Pseudobdellovibrio exovorus JSS]